MVVHLDVGDDRDLRLQLEEAGVALVGLGDDPLALPPAGVGGLAAGAEPRYLATDEEGRVGAERPQRPDQHRRRRRLAMGAGDGDQPLLGAELGEEGAAVDRLDPPLASQRQLRVVLTDRGRDHHLGALGQVRRVVADDRPNPGRPQPLHIRGVGPVAAADRRSKLGAHKRKPTHPGPADPNEMQPPGSPVPHVPVRLFPSMGG